LPVSSVVKPNVASPYATSAKLEGGVSRRVGLVIPPSPFLLDERVFVSLGVLKVAGVLEAAGHDVRVIDLSGVRNYEEAFEAYLTSSSDEVLGFTSTTPQLPSTFQVAAMARRARPETKLILGGPHLTLTYSAARLERKAGRMGRGAEALSQLEKAFDVLCPGDGEIAIFQAIQTNSPRIVDGDDRKLGYFMTNDFYDQTPFPARHLVDLESYRYSIEGHAATSLIAQLGCPFNCGFCGGRNSTALRVIRTRSTQTIIDEVEQLYREYGYTGFMFYDDELNVSPSMVELMNELTDLQDRLGAEFRLRGFVKSELLTEDQARAMYRAGFRWMLCGFEAAHPRILENIQKRATLEDNTRAVEIAKKHGLQVKALMSIGHPGESAESVNAVKDWLIKMEVEDFDCTIITTYPGTPYYDFSVPHSEIPGVWTYSSPDTGDCLHSKDVDFSVTADYYKGIPGGGYQAFVFTDDLTSEDLIRARDNIEASVRKKLDISFNPARPGIQFEHSMGQGLPTNILRSSG
jgi:anaerobic magnesium-protoporphyrin IX monomethyl ester cyclase